MDADLKTVAEGIAENADKGQARLSRLLARAAQVAAAAGASPEAFVNAAWQAFLHASPGLAERLVDMQLDAMVEELRSSGRLAKV
jgi:hypothetical protein